MRLGISHKQDLARQKLGPTRSSRLGGAAAADDVADSILVISLCGDDGARTIGANEMMMMMRPPRRRCWTAISYGVIDNRSENLQH
jgi:hypothetical protein